MFAAHAINGSNEWVSELRRNKLLGESILSFIRLGVVLRIIVRALNCQFPLNRSVGFACSLREVGITEPCFPPSSSNMVAVRVSDQH